MWPKTFFLLLTIGSIGAACAIAVIAALKKRYRDSNISVIGALIISALYGAALILAIVSAIYGTALIGAGLTAPERVLEEETLVLLTDNTTVLHYGA